MRDDFKQVPVRPDTIYVGGLKFTTDEYALKDYFSAYGKVISAKVRVPQELVGVRSPRPQPSPRSPRRMCGRRCCIPSRRGLIPRDCCRNPSFRHPTAPHPVARSVLALFAKARARLLVLGPQGRETGAATAVAVATTRRLQVRG
jgi:hypothetical protein